MKEGCGINKRMTSSGSGGTTREPISDESLLLVYDIHVDGFDGETESNWSSWGLI